MAEQGFISAYRSLRGHWLWDDKPFSKGQAWIDLLFQAAWRDHTELYRGSLVEWHRSEIHTSYVMLGDAWGWDRRKVERFLKLLEADGMVTVKTHKGGTSHGITVTIENYDVYQDAKDGDGTSDGTSDGTPHGTSDGASGGTHQNKDNKGNKVNKDNNSLKETSSEEDFIQQESNPSEKSDQINPTEKLSIHSMPGQIDQDQTDIVQTVVDMYNDICHDNCTPQMPKCRVISKRRRGMINARLKEIGIDGIRSVFEAAAKSDWLAGRASDWQADIEWLMNASNCLKVVEGNYTNRKPNGTGRADKHEGHNSNNGSSNAEIFDGPRRGDW